MVEHKNRLWKGLRLDKRKRSNRDYLVYTKKIRPRIGKGWSVIKRNWSVVKTGWQRFRSPVVSTFKWNWPTVKARFILYGQLIRFDKPIGWLLLLWPTLWALWLANEGTPSLHLIFVFVAGVFITRSAGVVVNDLADRDFDPFVERTKNRPIAAGRVSVKEACMVVAVLTLIAFLLVLTTNLLTVLLSVFAVCITLLYPLMKRYTYLPQVFLGFAFGWGIPMAFAASTNAVPEIAWLIFATNMLWVLIYDTIYAMVDREDDLQIGLKSTAILLDDADRLIIGIIQVMFIAALYSVGHQTGLGKPYHVALLPVAALMIYQQFLINDRTPRKCFKAFVNNNWVGLIIFSGIVLSV